VVITIALIVARLSHSVGSLLVWKVRNSSEYGNRFRFRSRFPATYAGLERFALLTVEGGHKEGATAGKAGFNRRGFWCKGKSYAIL
jgi:hypothetical protein